MVTKKKTAVKKNKVEEDSGSSLDDAFADDEGVEYAPSKPKKEKKKKGVDEEELNGELDEIESKYETPSSGGDIKVKMSKPVSKIKKGDKIKVDGVEYEVDSHYVLIDHGTTKEMAIELFDKNDKDYQIRYFDDQVEGTIDFYELQGEIMFMRKPCKKIEW